MKILKLTFASSTLLFSLGASAAWETIQLGELQNARIVPLKSDSVSQVFEIAVPNPSHRVVVTKGGTFEEVSLDGFGGTTDVGFAKLPVLRKMLPITSESARISVEAIDQKTVSLSALGLRYPLLPVQAPVAKIRGAFEAAPFALDADFYQQNQSYPAILAKLSPQGSIRGQKMAQLEISPLQYNPQQNTFTFTSKLKVTVYEKAAAPKADSYLSRLLSSRLLVNSVNSKVAKTNDRYLVVIGKGFEQNEKLKQFIQWKREKGFEVEVLSVNDLASFAPATLREKLRDVYAKNQGTATPLNYVLLVGDVDQVPGYQGAQYTDNYYAAIDTADYESDKTAPDVAVGRLSVQTDAELNTVLGKLMSYEKATFQTNNWIKKIAFLATDDRYEVAEGTHNYVIDTYTSSLLYSGIFPGNPEKGADKLFAITNHAQESDVLKSINDGRAIVSYSGHGAVEYWDAPRVTQSDLMSLTTTDVYPYAMSHACVAGSFGNASGDSFGETWLKAPHGAIGFWGTTNSSYWDEDDILERSFFDGMFKEKIRSVGMLNMRGLEGVRTHYSNGGNTAYYYEIYNLLGDPSVEIWTDTPTVLNPTVTQVGASIQLSNLPADARGVVTAADGTVLANAAVNGTQISIALAPSAIAKKITITAPNARPYEKTLAP